MDGEEDAKLLRSCFTGLYTLDDTAEGAKNAEMAIANPQKFVLKPQREGGGKRLILVCFFSGPEFFLCPFTGNNVYGADIPSFLSKLTPSERRAYILMDLIQPPEAQNIMVREGKAVHTSVISELGVYGVWVGDNASDSVYLNEACGHLLRTKSVGTNEGGVATGYSVLDSPLLY